MERPVLDLEVIHLSRSGIGTGTVTYALIDGTALQRLTIP